MLHHAIYPAGFAAAITLLLIVLLRRAAGPLGFLDHPDERRRHCQATPLVGGIAIYLALAVTACLWCPTWGDQALLWAAALPLVLVGMLDDIRRLGAGARFLAQIAAALVMIYLGDVRLVSLGDLVGTGEVRLGGLAAPFTVFAVVGVTNAINMSDGLDGLAGGVALNGLLWLLTLSVLTGYEVHNLEMIITLTAAVAVFLGFNLRRPGLPRAAVFLGDAGSLLLGFALAWLLVALAQGPDRVLAPVVALWLVALPLLDTVTVMLRRLGQGRNPCHADRQHLHHLLTAAGLADGQSTALLLAVAALLGGVGVAGAYWQAPEYQLLFGFLGLFAAYYLVTGWGWRRLDKAPREAASVSTSGPTRRVASRIDANG